MTNRPSQKPLPAQSEKHDLGFVLVVLALLLLVSVFFFGGDPGKKDSASTTPVTQPTKPTPAMLNRINEALQESQLKAEIQEGNVDSENIEAAPVDSSADPDPKVNPLVFDQENPGARILKETEKRANNHGTPSADQRINKKLERDEWSRDFEERREAEYIKQFIDNAHQNGVDVKLNENLEVTSVRKYNLEKPIRIPQSEAQPEKALSGEGASPK